MDLKLDLQYAVELTRGAGRIVLDHYGKVDRLTKRHQEAVTEADRASQRHIVAGLRKRYPTDGLIGEENETGDAITSEVPDPLGRVWVIDPLDGTNNFVAGLGNFAVVIGLLDAGRPVLGVVYDVTRDLLYAAAEGAWGVAGHEGIESGADSAGGELTGHADQHDDRRQWHFPQIPREVVHEDQLENPHAGHRRH